MCLGIPGKVVRWIDRDETFAQAEVEFDGVRRVCHMACATEAEEGDYVIVHAGIAISRVDPDEAQRVFEDLKALGDDDGWSATRPARQAGRTYRALGDDEGWSATET